MGNILPNCPNKKNKGKALAITQSESDESDFDEDNDGNDDIFVIMTIVNTNIAGIIHDDEPQNIEETYNSMYEEFIKVCLENRR